MLLKGASFTRLLKRPVQRCLRLALPPAAAAALLLLVLYYCRSSSAWGGTLQQEAGNSCGTARGPGQRVVAFSLYGSINHWRGYFQGVERNAAAVAALYPGWAMRVYHDFAPGSDAASRLEALARRFPHLDLCYVGRVPGYGDLRDRQQNAWRFLAMADPLVDVFVSRDLDAQPLEREAAAVAEWLESNLTFHVMRDLRGHSDHIMGGMWGARPELKREALRVMAEAVTSQPKGKKGADQDLLATHVWPAMKGDVWQHDAYYCESLRFSSHGHMHAFPTRRNETAAYNFVGHRVGVDTTPMLRECPLTCRPLDQPDWRYC